LSFLVVVVKAEATQSHLYIVISSVRPGQVPYV
jgi:hypothetical protein